MPRTVSDKIHPDDEMMAVILQTGRPRDVYFSSGENFMRKFSYAIKTYRHALLRGARVLDFGCGHGRVARFIPSVLAPAAFTVADLWEEAVKFCAIEFDANGIVIKNDRSITESSNVFDVIIACSVFSHLPPVLFKAYLVGLRDVLSKKGLLLFTTHGPSVAARHQVSLESGYHFGSIGPKPNHTDGRLPGEIYGFMAVTSDYVKNVLTTTKFNFLGYEKDYIGEQDLYICDRNAEE